MSQVRVEGVLVVDSQDNLMARPRPTCVEEAFRSGMPTQAESGEPAGRVGQAPRDFHVDGSYSEFDVDHVRW